MSKAFDSIKQGLDEALEFSKGKKGKAVVHKFTPVDVKNILDSTRKCNSIIW